MLTTLAATGFTVAFFHAAIPTHWLPFVLVARARGWSRGKTLAVSAFAGLGHVLLTSLLGLGIAWLGLELDEHFGELFSQVAGGLLLAIALWFFWKQSKGGVLHHHVRGSGHQPTAHCGHEHEHTHLEEELKGSKLVSSRTSDWAAITGLFAMLTLSPCEGFLPVYISGVQYGWRGFFVLSVILAVATLAGMMIFTLLTQIGFSKVRLEKLERYEAGMLGVVFAVLGLMMFFVEHGHGHAH